MTKRRALITIIFFSLIALLGLVIPQVDLTSRVTESYSITTCPGPVNGARGTALLPARSIGVRELERRNAEFNRSPLGTRSLSSGALLVAGDPRSTIALHTKARSWTSATTCNSGASISWFVGGTANVSSQGKLVLVNSGLSNATVEVTSFSEKGPQQPNPLTVRALSEREVRIDSFDPGAQRLVLRVEVLSGRVTTFLTDERVRGLSNIGGDFVTPIPKADRELVIPGLANSYGSASAVSHTLRIMSTTNSDATFAVEFISASGVFVPVGFGEIDLNAREVLDLPLPTAELGKKPFALKLEASAPIVAGIFTEVRKGAVSDFMWIPAVSSFEQVSFNLYGLEPVITFVGEQIDVRIKYQLRTGKSGEATLTGAEIRNWKVPAESRLIEIENRSGTRAGMSWLTSDGVAYLPVAPASTLESAPRPIADISVIQSRT